MANKIADRVQETTATTGTGTLTLAGAVAGYQTVVDGIGDGQTGVFLITDNTDWEVFIGTVTAGGSDTLTRDTVLGSSNADAAVNWGVGTKSVSLVDPASTNQKLAPDGSAGAPGLSFMGDRDLGIYRSAADVMAVSIGARFQQAILGFQSATLTLSSGAATGTLSRHLIAAESGTSDDLDTLTATNYGDGDVVWLRADAGDTIYVTTAGNFGQPVMLEDTTWVPFMWDGANSKWELALSGWIRQDKRTASDSAALFLSKGVNAAYDSYMVVFRNLRPATDNVDLYGYISVSGTVQEGGTDYDYALLAGDSASASHAAEIGTGQADMLLNTASIGFDADEGISGRIFFQAPTGTALRKLFEIATHHFNTETVVKASFGVGAFVTATSAIDGFQLAMSSGNITSGEAELFALRV